MPWTAKKYANTDQKPATKDYLDVVKVLGNTTRKSPTQYCVPTLRMVLDVGWEFMSGCSTDKLILFYIWIPEKSHKIPVAVRGLATAVLVKRQETSDRPQWCGPRHGNWRYDRAGGNSTDTLLISTSFNKIILLTYLLTYSMEQSPSWEEESFS
jgi:hypothetical protein